MGLAAQYILHDPCERALGIPARPDNPYDVGADPSRDAMFGTDGQLIYDDNSESCVYGDVILVNGVPWPVMEVEPRKYRFRVLNASVSRSYEFALDDGRRPTPMTVIATDGGLMPEPQPVTHLRHGMAERYEIVIDFSKYNRARSCTSRTSACRTTSTILDAATSCASTVGDGRDGPRADNDDPGRDSTRTWTSWASRTAARTDPPPSSCARTGSWTVNGQTWEDVDQQRVRRAARQARARRDGDLGDREPVRRLVPPVPHPPRRLQGPQPQRQAAPTPGSRARRTSSTSARTRRSGVIMRFSEPQGPGRYMMHCHNLVHEDHDMMIQFQVGDPDHLPDVDPITAAAAVWES